MDARIDAIGQGKIDDAVFTAERYSRFAMARGETIQARTSTTGHHHREGFPYNPINGTTFASFHLPESRCMPLAMADLPVYCNVLADTLGEFFYFGKYVIRIA